MNLTTEDTQKKKRKTYAPSSIAVKEFDDAIEDLMTYTGDGLVTDHLIDRLNAKHRQRHLKELTADQKEECANAKLIAAAPNLLRALEQTIPLLVAHANYTLGEGITTLQVARFAIAQAKT